MRNRSNELPTWAAVGVGVGMAGLAAGGVFYHRAEMAKVDKVKEHVMSVLNDLNAENEALKETVSEQKKLKEILEATISNLRHELEDEEIRLEVSVGDDDDPKEAFL